jgi:hypothetical protein
MALPQIPMSHPTLKSDGSNGMSDPSCLTTTCLFKKEPYGVPELTYFGSVIKIDLSSRK